MDIGRIILALMVPLAGTVVGAACVFFMKREMPLLLRKSLIDRKSHV